MIDLLKDESADHLSILNDLNRLFDKCLIVFYALKYTKMLYFLFKAMMLEIDLGETFLDMDILSSAIKIFENEEEDGKDIMVYLCLYYFFIYYVF